MYSVILLSRVIDCNGKDFKYFWNVVILTLLCFEYLSQIFELLVGRSKFMKVYCTKMSIQLSHNKRSSPRYTQNCKQWWGVVTAIGRAPISKGGGGYKTDYYKNYNPCIDEERVWSDGVLKCSLHGPLGAKNSTLQKFFRKGINICRFLCLD